MSLRVKLTYPDELVQSAVIWQLGHDFDLVTNVRRADVTAEVAWAVLEIDGTEQNIRAGISWLSTLGVRVDPVEDSIMDG